MTPAPGRCRTPGSRRPGSRGLGRRVSWLCRALTLIELLAVVVILGLVLGIGVTNLSAAHAEAQLERCASAWRTLDAEARILLMQRRDRPLLRLKVDEFHRRVVLSAGEVDVFDSIALPEGVEARLLVDGSTGSVGFDRRGCSPDYVFELRTPDRTRRWNVEGLTGWIHERSETENRP